MPSGVALILPAFAAVAAAMLYFRYQQTKKRRAAFAQLGTQLGLVYSQEDPWGTLEEPFGFFSRGDGRGVENVLCGIWEGMEVRVFDYWYYEQTSDGKSTSRTYYRFDCVLTKMPAASAHLTIDAETFLTRLADHLGLPDIAFESEDFNKSFNVKSRDKKFANDLIDARMMQWLLTAGTGYSYEVITDRVLVACRKVEPQELHILMKVAQGFVTRVPPVAVSLYPLGQEGPLTPGCPGGPPPGPALS
jgi:hypothetical protein